MRPKIAIFAVASLVAAVATVPVFSSDSPQSEDYRLLTDKEGNEVEARILSISSDRRTLRIERTDARVFEIEIVKLSLDYQQFLREWLVSQPGVSEAPQLEIAVQRNDGESIREKLESSLFRAVWERQKLAYQLSITNRAAGEVRDLTLEYCLLLRDRVTVRNAEDPDETLVRWRTQEMGEVRYLRGSVELPVLKYNREEIVDTSGLPFDLVRVSGGKRGANEDEPIGLIARVADSQGRTIAEFNGLQREFTELTWERLDARLGPGDSNRTGFLADKMALKTNRDQESF